MYSVRSTSIHKKAAPADHAPQRPSLPCGRLLRAFRLGYRVADLLRGTWNNDAAMKLSLLRLQIVLAIAIVFGVV